MQAASLIEANAADGNLGKRKGRLIRVGYTRYSIFNRLSSVGNTVLDFVTFRS